jgi:hypothetical protein
MGRIRFNYRRARFFCATLTIVLPTICATPMPSYASAVIGTYTESNILVADGATVYTAWVFADNTGLNGDLTWGTQHHFFLPPYATLIPGGLGVAFGKPEPARDFFEGNPMIFEFLSPPGAVSGRLVNQADQVSNKVGDLQFYRFTVNTNAPVGTGNFDLGPSTALTDPASIPQDFTKHNIPFTITSLEGDLTLDGFVGIADLNIVLGEWNQTVPPANPLADPSGDGFVGIADLNIVLGNWNAGSPPPATAVPEPVTATVFFIVGITTIRRPRTGATHC